jgi:hypothetical protein
MYFFVPYNISPIQQAIQAGHAALEYAWKFPVTQEYIDFMTNDKTWVILNGGTTNDTFEKESDDGFAVVWRPAGVINQIESYLILNKIRYSKFIEPDLNNALTAVCFLADERVWDYEAYPEFADWLFDVKMYKPAKDATPVQNQALIRRMKTDELNRLFPEYVYEWVNTVLGKNENLFLRDLIRGKKLA